MMSDTLIADGILVALIVLGPCYAYARTRCLLREEAARANARRATRAVRAAPP